MSGPLSGWPRTRPTNRAVLALVALGALAVLALGAGLVIANSRAEHKAVENCG